VKPFLEHPKESARLSRSAAFGGLETLQARFVKFSFVPHSHAEYTVGLIAQGSQQFRYRGARHLTPARGFFVLHPGESHTGAPADDQGFTYRAFYPSADLMRLALNDAVGSADAPPYFQEVVQSASELSRGLLELLQALPNVSALEGETRVLVWLRRLLRSARFNRSPVSSREPRAILEARAFLEAQTTDAVSLMELSNHVGLSPFYFARSFTRAVGLPPHAYHENVRIRQAKLLLEAGHALAEVAFLTGFSHQSHFTERFRRHVGVSPGRYQQGKITQDT
jgi:AraC-like DNA-binding protein